MQNKHISTLFLENMKIDIFNYIFSKFYTSYFEIVEPIYVFKEIQMILEFVVIFTMEKYFLRIFPSNNSSRPAWYLQRDIKFDILSNRKNNRIPNNKKRDKWSLDK